MSSYIPQVVPTRRPLMFWAISAIFVTVGVLQIIAAPLADASGYGDLADGIYRAFAPFCHQLSERSYFINGHKLAVCSRCTGIYFGFAFTLVLYPLVRSLRNAAFPARRWLILATLPLIVDWGLTFIGIWENTHTSRLLTGLLLGGTAVFYVMPGIIDLSFKLRRRPLTPESPHPTFTLNSAEAIASAPSDYRAPERRI
ncbi:MAG: DUF2085 domain-containing protein [Pyrinomonadaceae bacterium]